MKGYVVYVLRNGEGRLYVGQTDDVERRVEQHNMDESRWTAGKGPWELVHMEEYPTRADAMRREKALKAGRLNQELRRRFGC
jgi:putative endonuclease